LAERGVAPEALARMLCPTGSDSAVTLVGEVRSAGNKSPLANATVSVEWPEWVFGKKSTVREEVRRTARTDSVGRYVLCGAPRGTVVSAQAWQASDSTGSIEFGIPESAYAVLSLFVDIRASAPTAAAQNAAGPAPVRSGAGIVRGAVRTSTAAALPGAIVRVIGSGAAVRPDTMGSFFIVDAVGGTKTVEARAIGYVPERRAVQLEPGVPLEVSFALNKRSVLLDTVRVVAGRTLPYDVQALERRWRQGQGTFLDGATVRDRANNMITNALTGIPGIRIVSGRGWGNNIGGRSFTGAECRATLFLDGFRLSTPGQYPATLDEMVAPDEVAVLEVYARSSTVPAEYLTMDGCGVVAVWTKRGLGKCRYMIRARVHSS
ncbi:MAG: carboxypeptidase regulatory-like domain-containing protein, partial [Gemmatimonas sp.]